MRTPRRWTGSALLALGALLLSSCGDDGGVSGAPETTTTAAPETTTTGAPETTTTAAPETTAPEGPGSFEVFLLAGDPDDCSAVTGVARAATVEGAPADALAQLLAGPTDEETQQGLTSWFSAETAGMLRGVAVEDGLARVDFDDFSQVIPNASSSCGSAGLLAQLDSTVLQFPEIERVVYSFDGDQVAFYEWLQLSPPG